MIKFDINIPAAFIKAIFLIYFTPFTQKTTVPVEKESRNKFLTTYTSQIEQLPFEGNIFILILKLNLPYSSIKNLESLKKEFQRRVSKDAEIS